MMIPHTNSKDYYPTETEMQHYEKCSDGVVSIETAKRLVRMIRTLQQQINVPGAEK